MQVRFLYDSDLASQFHDILRPPTHLQASGVTASETAARVGRLGPWPAWYRSVGTRSGRSSKKTTARQAASPPAAGTARCSPASPTGSCLTGLRWVGCNLTALSKLGLTCIFFFGGLYLQENFIWKTSIFKNKDNKISQGRGNSLRNEVRG